MKRDTLISIGFAAILVLLGASYVYQGGALWGPCRYDGGMMGGGMHYGGTGFFGLGFHGFGIFFWIMVAFFLYLILSKKDEEGAMDILNKRFARGEISKEEYQKMKEEIVEEKGST